MANRLYLFVAECKTHKLLRIVLREHSSWLDDFDNFKNVVNKNHCPVNNDEYNKIIPKMFEGNYIKSAKKGKIGDLLAKSGFEIFGERDTIVWHIFSRKHACGIYDIIFMPFSKDEAKAKEGAKKWLCPYCFNEMSATEIITHTDLRKYIDELELKTFIM